MVVMPLLVLGFYALQLDRGNMYVPFVSQLYTTGIDDLKAEMP